MLVIALSHVYILMIAIVLERFYVKQEAVVLTREGYDVSSSSEVMLHRDELAVDYGVCVK